MTEMAKKPASSRDKTTARRRSQILEAAVMCFLERGYHQTGVRDIAARAGVSLGNLYNHFSGKHDVLVEIAVLERQEMEPFLKILSARAPAKKVLEKFISAYAKYLAAPENVILTLELSSEAIRQPDIARLFLENHEELTNALTAVLQKGIDAGELRNVPDVRQMSQMIIEVLEGGAYRCVLAGASMRDVVKSVKDFVLTALLPR